MAESIWIEGGIMILLGSLNYFVRKNTHQSEKFMKIIEKLEVVIEKIQLKL